MNKKVQQFIDNLDKAQKEQCKNNEIAPLLEMADVIKKSAKVKTEAPSRNFKEQLKEKILTGRADKRPIFNLLNMKELFKSRFFAPALAGVLVVALFFTSVLIWPQSSDFSKLVVGSAYAQDNFELSPTKADSLGVESDSKYILKSKQSLDTALIEENLKISPVKDFKLTALSDKEWEIDLGKSVKENSLLQISLPISYIAENGEQVERDYSWAYQVKDSFKVLHSIPRNESSNVPLNTGVEISFSHDNFYNFGKYFSISPTVKGTFEKHGRTAVFVPAEELAPKTIYTVTLKKDLPLKESKEALNEDYSFSFETSDAEGNAGHGYSFNVYSKFSEVSTSEKPLINVSAYPIEDASTVEVYRFNNSKEFVSALREIDSLPAWSSSYSDYRINTDNLSKVISFAGDIKEQPNSGIQYIEFPEKIDAGFYVANISYKENLKQIFIQSSDLLTYINGAKNDTLVWVNNLRTGVPVSNATIEFLDTDLKYETDDKGIAKFKTPEDLNDKNAYLKIQKGEDILILKTSELKDFDSKEKTLNDYWKYFYTDRPIYLPNDTIKYWGMLKDRSGDEIKEKITVSLYKSGYVDYYYQPVKIFEQEITLDDFGVFTGEIPIKDLYPDYYNLEINIGDLNIETKYISVEAYVKPLYQLTLNSDNSSYFANETVQFTAKAGFFEGTPVPDLELVYSTPDGEKTATTDESGEITFSYKKPYHECKNNFSCWPDWTDISVRPKNSELAEIEASKSLRFYGPKVYLTGETEYPEKGKARVSFQAKFLDLSALDESSWWDYSLGKEPAPNTKIEGTVTKITYNRVETGNYYDFIDKKVYKQYSYDRKDEVVDNFTAYTDASGNYVYEQPISPDGSYELKVKYFDADGKSDVSTYYLYYYNGSYLYEGDEWASDYVYYHFKLNNDTKETSVYKLGETVEAYFMKDEELLGEKADSYLYMQMQNGLLGHSVSSSSVYSFDFEREDIPNINLVGLYFNGNSYNEIHRTIAYNNKEKALKINISSDKDKYEPGEEVELSVEVSDMNGNPVEAEVNVNLVDEAYYAVAEDYANPIDSIYSYVYAGQILSEISHSFPNSYGGAEKGGCFAAGTKILMSNGTQKPIEDIVAGDKITTFSNPIDKNLVEGTVTETQEHLVDRYLLINNSLRVTPEHLVFVDSHFDEAGRLKPGDLLLQSDGTKLKVDTIKMINKPTKVYNFRVDPQHTYFADNIYVHNEKGGGPREFFADAALFEVIKTDSFGKGKTEFNLPDNVTSWRITAQAISKNLFVGINTSKIPVSLPVFTEVTMANEYLVADSPVVKIRAYGSALEKDDDVKFSLESSGIETVEKAAKAFAAVYLPLPSFPLGKTFLTYSLETDKGNDAIKLPLNIIESRLQVQSAISKKLSLDAKVDFPNSKPVLVVLGDEGQNQLYGALTDLSWDFGDRVDQKLARGEAKELLNEYYNETAIKDEFKTTNYQLPNGGISLLPYSSAELELSARVAALGAEGFDKNALVNYLFSKLENENSTPEEISLALFGLAELGQPVLTRLNTWLDAREDLPVIEKLYLAQALADLGSKEDARKIYYEIMKKYGEENKLYIMLKISKNSDEIFKATALAATLASSLNSPESMKLWNYLEDGQVLHGSDKNSETLFGLEKINFIKHKLPQLKPSPAKVEYTLSGKKEKITLTDGQMHSFQVYPEQKDELKFISVEGDVGLTIVYASSVEKNDIKANKDVSIGREYYVNGVKTNEFKEGDIIEVRLIPSVDSKSINSALSEYQITDILPSGLAPITKLASQYDDYSKGTCFVHPYSIDGQKVKFSYSGGRSWCPHEIQYLARVKNVGEYLAEPAVIQAYLDPNAVNYSKQEEIKITE